MVVVAAVAAGLPLRRCPAGVGRLVFVDEESGFNTSMTPLRGHGGAPRGKRAYYGKVVARNRGKRTPP